MGNQKQKYLITLIALLAVTALLVHRPGSSAGVSKPLHLDQALAVVDGYSLARSLPLDEQLTAYLMLDDYTNLVFEREGIPISLYIGYYFSIETVSAAHGPLVCFPAQGWQVSAYDERKITVGNKDIHYAELLASLGEHQELVLYWSQAHDQTTRQFYRNKIQAVINKLRGGHGEHAFVRVTVPLKGGEIADARIIAEQFITAFYPEFLTYVGSSRSVN